jgi:hypothetical protein
VKLNIGMCSHQFAAGGGDFSDADPLHVPPDDVNRIVKLATALQRQQQNIVLDSGIDEKESLRPSKSAKFCARRAQCHKKSAPGKDALEKV